MAATPRGQVDVCPGQAGRRAGSLVYARHGRREHCTFAYDDHWLVADERFSVSAKMLGDGA